jgi:hypothetical protein
MTSVLVGDERSVSRPGRFTAGTHDKRLGGPQSRSGRRGEEGILDPTGFRTPTSSVVQPVASRYTEYAIPAQILHMSLPIL